MSTKFNPYYAYVQLEFANFSINNIDNGAISLEISWEEMGVCTFVITLYDDSAHKLADSIIKYGTSNMILTYGYSRGAHLDETTSKTKKSLRASIMDLHTQLTGHGETLILEGTAFDLYKVTNPGSNVHTKMTMYPSAGGSHRISDIVEEVIQEVGWTPGYIEPTVDGIRGINNDNDDVNNPEDVYRWDTDETFIDFMGELASHAVSAETGKADYIVNVEYFMDKPPVVDFFSKGNSKGSGSNRIHYSWIYGDPTSNIMSIDVNWGMALLTFVGATGSVAVGFDSSSNTITQTGQKTGHTAKAPNRAKANIPYTPGSKILSKKTGYVNGPEGSETYYGGLKPTSWAYKETIRLNPQMANWAKQIRSDGVQTFGGYVVVAADTTRIPRGTIVATTRGDGIVVDHCERSANMSTTHFDIAVSKKAEYGWYNDSTDY